MHVFLCCKICLMRPQHSRSVEDLKLTWYGPVSVARRSRDETACVARQHRRRPNMAPTLLPSLLANGGSAIAILLGCKNGEGGVCLPTPPPPPPPLPSVQRNRCYRRRHSPPLCPRFIRRHKDNGPTMTAKMQYARAQIRTCIYRKWHLLVLQLARATYCAFVLAGDFPCFRLPVCSARLSAESRAET